VIELAPVPRIRRESARVTRSTPVEHSKATDATGKRQPSLRAKRKMKAALDEFLAPD
jgi:hypothetical protein